MSVLASIAQNSISVKKDFNNRNELLALADDCLERHRDAWARWLVSGDHQAFLQAMAAQQDRAQLLAQAGEVRR